MCVYQNKTDFVLLKVLSANREYIYSNVQIFQCKQISAKITYGVENITKLKLESLLPCEQKEAGSNVHSQDTTHRRLELSPSGAPQGSEVGPIAVMRGPKCHRPNHVEILPCRGTHFDRSLRCKVTPQQEAYNEETTDLYHYLQTSCLLVKACRVNQN